MNAPSFFEGTEKKVELALEPGAPSLREVPRSRWRQVVRTAGAELLSRISNAHCDAYLLSESSLFVFRNKVILLTCGCSRLHDAVIDMLRFIPAAQVSMFFYERKNEVFPHRQPTDFFEDARVLDRHLPGRAYQFGHEDEHHVNLFHLDREYPAAAEDTTVEVLMHGIDPAVGRHFGPAMGGTTAAIREATGVDRLIEGFAVDDHLFEPAGYSLNALRDEAYYTVHVTPEDHGSYASFETNHDFGGDLDGGIRGVIEVFRPRSFDVVLFGPPGARRTIDPGFRLRSHVAQELDCGYRVDFMSYYRPQATVETAVELHFSEAARR